MLFIISIFLISTFLVFFIVLYRSWEIKTGRVVFNDEINKEKPSRISFRYVEIVVLHIVKKIVQIIILFFAKIYYIIETKITIIIKKYLPKIINLFKTKQQSSESKKISFMQRAVIESKIGIKRIKEKIKEEHDLAE